MEAVLVRLCPLLRRTARDAGWIRLSAAATICAVERLMGQHRGRTRSYVLQNALIGWCCLIGELCGNRSGSARMHPFSRLLGGAMIDRLATESLLTASEHT
jgi:hypothetical protein